MSSYYAGKIKVVTESKMCFPVDPATLEPLAPSTRDLHWSDEPEALEIISYATWLRRCAEAVDSKAIRSATSWGERRAAINARERRRMSCPAYQTPKPNTK